MAADGKDGKDNKRSDEPPKEGGMPGLKSVHLNQSSVELQQVLGQLLNLNPKLLSAFQVAAFADGAAPPKR